MNSDLELWLSTKLESPWSSERVSSLLTPEIVAECEKKLPQLESLTKLRLLFSFVAVRRNALPALQDPIVSLLKVAFKADSDEWVRHVAGLLLKLWCPVEGTSVMIEEVNSQINSVMNSLSTRLEGGTSRNHGCGYMPLEACYLQEDLVAKRTQPVSHFNIRHASQEIMRRNVPLAASFRDSQGGQDDDGEIPMKTRNRPLPSFPAGKTRLNSARRPPMQSVNAFSSKPSMPPRTSLQKLSSSYRQSLLNSRSKLGESKKRTKIIDISEQPELPLGDKKKKRPAIMLGLGDLPTIESEMETPRQRKRRRREEEAEQKKRERDERKAAKIRKKEKEQSARESEKKKAQLEIDRHRAVEFGYVPASEADLTMSWKKEAQKAMHLRNLLLSRNGQLGDKRQLWRTRHGDDEELSSDEEDDDMDVDYSHAFDNLIVSHENSSDDDSDEDEEKAEKRMHSLMALLPRTVIPASDTSPAVVPTKSRKKKRGKDKKHRKDKSNMTPAERKKRKERKKRRREEKAERKEAKRRKKARRLRVSSEVSAETKSATRKQKRKINEDHIEVLLDRHAQALREQDATASVMLRLNSGFSHPGQPRSAQASSSMPSRPKFQKVTASVPQTDDTSDVLLGEVLEAVSADIGKKKGSRRHNKRKALSASSQFPASTPATITNPALHKDAVSMSHSTASLFAGRQSMGSSNFGNVTNYLPPSSSSVSSGIRFVRPSTNTEADSGDPAYHQRSSLSSSNPSRRPVMAMNLPPTSQSPLVSGYDSQNETRQNKESTNQTK